MTTANLKTPRWTESTLTRLGGMRSIEFRYWDNGTITLVMIGPAGGETYIGSATHDQLVHLGVNSIQAATHADN